MTISITINGEPREFGCEDDARLLDVLREHAGLTSVREGCGVGTCGTCTVLLEGSQ